MTTWGDSTPADKHTQSLVRELLDVEHGLTDWEVTFIESLADLRTFTTKQAAKVRQIHERITDAQL